LLQADGFAFLEELRIDHGDRLQLLLVVVCIIFVAGTHSREEVSNGWEFNVSSRANALNLTRPNHRCEPNVGPALQHPGTGSVISHVCPRWNVIDFEEELHRDVSLREWCDYCGLTNRAVQRQPGCEPSLWQVSK
jgi:hypothetical protein